MDTLAKFWRFMKRWAILLVIAQTVMIVLRSMATGMRHAQIRRVHELTTTQLMMILGSRIIWSRLAKRRANGGPQHVADSEEKAPMASNGAHRRGSSEHGFVTTLKARGKDLYRALLFCFLLLSHSAWLFFYIYLPEDTLISICAFLCLSVYVHMVAFMALSFFVERTMDFCFPHIKNPLLTSRPLHTWGSVFLAVLLTSAGVMVTRTQPTLKAVDVHVQSLPADLNGFSIALLTDVHIGPTVSRSRVEDIVRIVNSLNADVVTIVGDLVDGFVPYLGKRAAPLSTLRSKYGTFFTPGNHEYYHGPIEEWLDFFEKELNMTVLRNANKIISKGPENTEICFAGLDDLSTTHLFIEGYRMDVEKTLAGCPDGMPTVLLAHQPNAARKVLEKTKKHVDLILSGHTHGGQFYILKPFSYLANAYLHGLYRHVATGAQIYVSSGVNYWGPPVKMWNLCEIVLLRLRPGA
ncbi:Protein F40B5.2 a [Aphelenchoides avenae]|nr:Protein F40B5.2 a [Aphelenchus avenae]